MTVTPPARLDPAGVHARHMRIEELLHFCDVALDGMTAIVVDLGDDLASRRPPLPGANSPYAILTHCLGVMEWWGGAVVAGRPVERDRDAEFVARGPVSDLVDRVADARAQLRTDADAVPPDEAPRGDPGPRYFGGLELSAGGVLLHVLEELCQHHGQMELTRDLLRAGEAQDR